MKKIKITILCVLIIFFNSCGGGGGSSSGGNISSNGKNSSTIQMQRGKAYEVQDGKTVVKKSDDAKIEIETDLKTGITTVTLLQGKAVIE